MAQTNKAIIDAFLARHDRAKFEAKQREAAVYDKLPRLAELDAQRDLAGIRYTKARCMGDADALNHFNAEIDAIETERNAVLHAAGIDPKHLAPTITCPDCGDTGYVNGAMCHCLRRELVSASFGRYDLKPQAKTENFGTFRQDVYPAERQTYVRGILSIFTKYCKHFDAVEENYLFSGKPGLGKTFLSNCIVNALLEQDYAIIYITAAHLVKLVQETMYSNVGDERALYQALLDCDLLVIDDLGAEYSTKFSSSQLFEIINARLLDNRRMIISTNLTTDAIFTRYDERLSSRIRGNFKTIPFVGDDIRLMTQAQGNGSNKN